MANRATIIVGVSGALGVEVEKELRARGHIVLRVATHAGIATLLESVVADLVIVDDDSPAFSEAKSLRIVSVTPTTPISAITAVVAIELRRQSARRRT